MDKSPDAFRTISEVADWLGTPTHVLRFWESRFTQVKPVKRAGGRRYYRPADMELLGGIKRLLHDDGMTIRGVQKLLREEGVKHVAALSGPLSGSDLAELGDVVEGSLARDTPPAEPADIVENVVTLEIPETAAEPETIPADQPPPDAEAAPAGTDDDPTDSQAEPEPAETKEPFTPAEAKDETEPTEDLDSDPTDNEEAGVSEPPKTEPAPEPPAPTPIEVDVPDDPADDDPHLPGITDVAASLRRASEQSDASASSIAAIGDIYNRLVALRERMAGTPEDSQSD